MSSLALRAANLLPLSVLVWVGHMLVFHGTGALFAWCDRKRILQAFKVRRSRPSAYVEFLPRVLFNQICILLPAMWLCEASGRAFVGPRHVGVGFALVAIALMTIGHDIVQYISHRFLLHNSRLRILGHRLHHSTGASCSISACYMSAPDFFLTIVCPYLIPLIAIGGGSASVEFQLLLSGLGAIGGLYEHSGYDLSVLDRGKTLLGRPSLFRRIAVLTTSSHAHGEHHRRSRVSFSDGFGSPGLCDTIFRTRWDLC